jgi:hypothetical protein
MAVCLRVRNARFEWPNLAIPYCFCSATPRYCDGFFRNFILKYVNMNIDEGLNCSGACASALRFKRAFAEEHQNDYPCRCLLFPVNRL